MLALTAVCSVRHWQHFVMGSTAQSIDQMLARVSIAVHAYFLLLWGKHWVMLSLLLPTVGLYMTGRHTRRRFTALKAPTPEAEAVPHSFDSGTKREIARLYNLHTVVHTSFRYFAFWLITYTHSFSSSCK
jgi:hypothetical protein